MYTLYCIYTEIVFTVVPYFYVTELDAFCKTRCSTATIIQIEFTVLVPSAQVLYSTVTITHSKKTYSAHVERFSRRIVVAGRYDIVSPARILED